MDLSKYRNKLIGSEEERAVSPVIGVILMVAITVILAAVIAAFVLDMGDSMGDEPVTATVDTDVSNSDDEITITATDPGNAEEFIVRGDSQYFDSGSSDESSSFTFSGAGDSKTFASGDLNNVDEITSDGSESGTLNVVAVRGDDEQQIATIEFSYNTP